MKGTKLKVRNLAGNSVVTELRAAEVEKLSPLQAYDLLIHLKQRLDEAEQD